MAVKKRKSKWVVTHCHGKGKGKTIGTHKTKKGAVKQHRAIKASKRRKRGK